MDQFEIRRQFDAKTIDAMTATQMLIGIGVSPDEAENIVKGWVLENMDKEHG